MYFSHISINRLLILLQSEVLHIWDRLLRIRFGQVEGKVLFTPGLRCTQLLC